METSLYKISFKDGRVFNVFCGNKKQNQDMLRFLTSPQGLGEVKRKGAQVVSVGIHDMLQFKKIMEHNNK